jgi:hypothetical protein
MYERTAGYSAASFLRKIADQSERARGGAVHGPMLRDAAAAVLWATGLVLGSVALYDWVAYTWFLLAPGLTP